MNRRDLLKASVGAGAALLLPKAILGVPESSIKQLKRGDYVFCNEDVFYADKYNKCMFRIGWVGSKTVRLTTIDGSAGVWMKKEKIDIVKPGMEVKLSFMDELYEMEEGVIHAGPWKWLDGEITFCVKNGSDYALARPEEIVSLIRA